MLEYPLVVGYKGEIGSFILQGLLRSMPKALNILCFDINESEEEKIDRIKQAGYIFLCVPLQETLAWLVKYKQYLTSKIIIEQCSLKSFLTDPHLNDLHFIHMHILFRPSATPNKADRKCIILRENCSSSVEKILESILDGSKVKVLPWTTEQHDHVMAYNQALVHRIILTLDDICNQDAPTYVTKRITELADRIKAGDKELYSLIQKNKSTVEVTDEFREMLDGFDIDNYM